MLQAGKYKARAVDVKLCKVNNEKETPYVAVVFEVVDGESKGERVKWEGWLSEAAQERTLESLVHCGWDQADIRKLESVKKKDATIIVEHEQDAKDPKKTWPKVAWVNALSNGPSLEKSVDLDAGSADSLAAQIKSKGPINVQAKFEV